MSTAFRPSEFRMREATVGDVEDIAGLICSAFPADPQWNYRFPRRCKFPEDTFEFTCRTYRDFLEGPDKEHFEVKILTHPDSVSRPDLPRLVAVAVWKLEYNTPSPHSQHHKDLTVKHNDRRDADWERMQAFKDALQQGKETYFDSVCGNSQIQLVTLGTHPKFQRQGAGTQLCRWGMQLADQRHLLVTVFASPSGQKLYRHLGFKEVGVVIVQVKDEEEKLTISAMTFNVEYQTA